MKSGGVMSNKEFFGGLNILDHEEERIMRQRLRLMVLWILFGAFIAACAVYGIKKARADEYASQRGEVKLVRHQAPCDDADIGAHILRLGGGELLGQFKKATLTYGGREWRSCWVEVHGMVYSVDEEGEPLQAIPASMFKDGGA